MDHHSEGRPPIAFLGMGLMGQPMARRLLGAGFPVAVWNRTPDKARALEADGAVVCTAPEEAVARAQVVVTMLLDGPAVTAVLTAPPVLEALGEGELVIDMSSIPPATAREHNALLAKRGVLHLDAPVSGGTRGADAGTLAIMVGGTPAAYAAAQTAAVFEAMGRPTHVGPSGTGQLAKLCNQIIVAVSIGAVSEAILMARAGGADPAAFIAAVAGGFADSTILRQHGRRMTEGNFQPGGMAATQLKDLHTILDTARGLGLPDLPFSDLATRLYTDLVTAGDGGLDHSALFRQIERRNTPGTAP